MACPRTAFPELSPPQYDWGRFFFQGWSRRGPLRAGHGIPSSTDGISDIVKESEIGVNPAMEFFLATLSLLSEKLFKQTFFGMKDFKEGKSAIHPSNLGKVCQI